MPLFLIKWKKPVMADFKRTVKKHLFSTKKHPSDKDGMEEYPFLTSILSNKDIVDTLKKATESTETKKEPKRGKYGSQ